MFLFTHPWARVITLWFWLLLIALLLANVNLCNQYTKLNVGLVSGIANSLNKITDEDLVIECACNQYTISR